MLWCVQYVEFACNNAGGKALPGYLFFVTLLIGVAVPFFDLIFCREDYEILKLKESLQIHRLCMFLAEFQEIGREEIIKRTMRISGEYYQVLRGILLCFVTGREPEWEEVIKKSNRFANARILHVMWIRIIEHIREMDMVGNTKPKDLLISQYEYANKICYEYIYNTKQRRIFLCKVIAYLPIFCTIIFYMIYPFIREGIRMLGEYSKGMQLLG